MDDYFKEDSNLDSMRSRNQTRKKSGSAKRKSVRIPNIKGNKTLKQLGSMHDRTSNINGRSGKSKRSVW